MREKVGKKSGEASWSEVVYRYVDKLGDEVKKEEERDEAQIGIGKRGAMAASTDDEIDGGTVVVWGGIDQVGRVRRDGLLISVGR